ncbi:MAG: riboflavin biosynthesis protein RibF [Elusimicrobia bacterium RIFCSPLOWO2_02_FULL_39_32]|nr:MAG: riboflavin biosynthesis protein RibF [Elusimicrobia bacterium RIFCSPHIGHO2_02_FULL_39_36]OGR92036.1 MAG: riboflavin biosynthesis protein RibF [Elusimicrobia bacterium RIFCSPLOWO2_02_FULL_39_32]OGR98673.1 MAG: riboflavin biosynthesis protein RibF [Elusimicrobia bacterium RIFCSPLOWO2_12_FULL_39_28]
MSKHLGAVLTIGTFDGLHRGHLKIIKRVLKNSLQFHLPSLAITFEFPPRLFFTPLKEPYLLSTPEEKSWLLKEAGIKKVVVLKFNKRCSLISAKEFFLRFLKRKYQAKNIVVGYNFCFGRDRLGDIPFLKKMGKENSIPITVIKALEDQSAPVSSGRIRAALRKGDLETAHRFLGHPYFCLGRVNGGRKIGTKLGFPTANLKISDLKILPLGVFLCRVGVGFKDGKLSGADSFFYGICNVGFKPTLKEAGKPARSLEAHLFNFSGKLYGKILKLEFLKKIRDEKKFQNLDDLRKQLEKDKKTALLLLRKLLI